MKKDIYAPSPVIHAVGIAGPLFLGWLAYRCSVDEFVNGGLGIRIGLVGACVVLAGLIVWLYFRSGITVYRITESGLEIKRIGAPRLVPWEQIKEIAWNQPLHFITLRGPKGVIAFASTDYFPAIGEFIEEVHLHSGCKLPDAIERAINEATNTEKSERE